MTAAVRLWVSLRGNVQSISDPVLNDTQSVRAHKQMRSMVEVAFLNRCGRGKNHNNQHRGLEVRPVQNGMVSIANHKFRHFPMLSSHLVARVCSRAGLAW